MWTPLSSPPLHYTSLPSLCTTFASQPNLPLPFPLCMFAFTPLFSHAWHSFFLQALPHLCFHFLAYFPVHSDSIHVYINGYKSSLHSGFAVLFPDTHFHYHLPSESSVLRTELYAILFALKIKCLSCFPSSSFTIFTDSWSSIPYYLPSPHHTH